MSTTRWLSWKTPKEWAAVPTTRNTSFLVRGARRCLGHQDWLRRRNPELARQLYQRGVSAAWFRPRGKRVLTIEVLLAATGQSHA